jgi:hypothetical protein
MDQDGARLIQRLIQEAKEDAAATAQPDETAAATASAGSTNAVGGEAASAPNPTEQAIEQQQQQPQPQPQLQQWRPLSRQELVAMIHREVLPATRQLVTDPFGNYVLQKLFECALCTAHCTTLLHTTHALICALHSSYCVWSLPQLITTSVFVCRCPFFYQTHLQNQ